MLFYEKARRDADCPLSCLRLLEHVLWIEARIRFKVVMRVPWLDFRTEMAYDCLWK